MKKIRIVICMMLLLLLFMTGCGNAIPEMSEEQQELVVEYAAGTLLKYNRNHDYKLLDVSMLPEEESISDEQAFADEAEDVDISLEEKLQPTEEGQATGTAEEASVGIEESGTAQNSSMEEVLRLNDFMFQYGGYELKQSYPDDGADLYFVMDASEGNQLLVLKFAVENISSAEAELNINQMGARFKIAVDGEQKNVLTTMLLNDLAHYQGVFAAGESKELVLVREITDQQAETFANLAVIVKNVDNTATISLN